MIIPVVFSLNPIFDNVWYTWCFRKAISFAKGKHGVVIAQSQYFEREDLQRKNFPQAFTNEFAENFDYEIPQPDDLDKIIQIKIPKEIEKKFIELYPSQTDAYLQTFKVDWPEMEEFIIDSVQEIMRKESVEAFIMMGNVQFMTNVSKKLNIPVFHYETGPMRNPFYRKTAYLDLKGVYGHSSLKEKYDDFMQSGSYKNVPIFTNSEILALFLEKWCLDYAIPKGNMPEYEVGIMFGYNVPDETASYNGMTSAEILTEVRKHFREEDICVRYHPGDPIGVKLKAENVDTGHLLDFMSKCKRIVCKGSNCAYEGMLYGRSTYDLGWSQYSFIVDNALETLKDEMAPSEYMSFVAFAHLVPFELLNDEEYLRYRLSNPSVTDIYIYHLKYYLKCLNIPYTDVYDQTNGRLDRILMHRESNLAISDEDFSEYPIWLKKGSYARKCIECHQLQNKNMNLKEKVDEVTKELDETKIKLDCISNELNAIKESKAYRAYKFLMQKIVVRKND